MAEQIEACTTEARRKRHYSAMLVPDWRTPPLPGRAGDTLCGQRGRDEVRANVPVGQYKRKPVRVADLPECSLCCRSKAKLERESEVISGA
jgi:hypothetical protein